ncbi:MAG: hypothetical protein M3Y65_22855 [Pseudomonadota bacterium]|nr:hypothetical protein [Pseudomonadota bacterium]
MRALAFDSLSDLRRRRLVADNLIDALLATPGDGRVVWQLMMLEQWFVHRAPHRMAVTAATAPEPASAPAPGIARAPACRADEPYPAGVHG